MRLYEYETPEMIIIEITNRDIVCQSNISGDGTGNDEIDVDKMWP